MKSPSQTKIRHPAFITEYGLYEWVVACFGLKNAPAEFARFMSETLKEYLNEFVVVYFDDIIIFSKTMTEHWGHVRKVLEKLRKAKINLKIKKCEFAVQEVEYLGHVVNGDHTKMQKSKIEAILNWPTPTTLKNIEEFRGLAGYYRQYIEKFSDKARPLNEALRKTEFKWGEEEEKAFQELKNSYRGNKILILFNPEKQIFVHTDASEKTTTSGGELLNTGQGNARNCASDEEVSTLSSRNEVSSITTKRIG